MSATPRKALERAIAILDGRRAAAEALKISRQNLEYWLRARVPADRCPEIERATHALVRCEELRPDIDWAVLRNHAA
jgi:DNA-binding transcriptional regulator YdaS (Cro superfamily)